MLRHCEVEDQCYDGIYGTCKGCNRRTALDMAIEALEADIPRGYWKRNTTYKSLVFCSECDMPYEAGVTPRNFCPNCGADMRVEDE